MKTPRQLIRKCLPLDGVPSELAEALIEDCFQMYVRDPDRRSISAIIGTYKIQMNEATKERN